jgi:predicted nucleic acid-binding protein
VYQVVIDTNGLLAALRSRRGAFIPGGLFLPDPKDDFVLELAVESRCDFIVTYNAKDFAGAEKFGLEVVTPLQFLRELGEIA